jgi:peptide alpha-N-acetyltransferase
MIRWEDHLRDHPYYTRAAINAIKTYILLHEKPHLAHGTLPNGINRQNGGLDPSEQKKAARKARKAQEKQDQLEAEKAEAKKAVGADGEAKKVDKDPEGKLLVETAEPLKDAMKFLTPLLEFSPKSLEAQKWGFEVYIRRSRSSYPSTRAAADLKQRNTCSHSAAFWPSALSLPQTRPFTSIS